MLNTKEYAIIIKNLEDLDSIYQDLEHEGCGSSEYCPTRCVECSLRKPSSRVTYYKLTQEEVELLKSDPRIDDIELSHTELPINITPVHKLNGNFIKTIIPDQYYYTNWGLLLGSENGIINNWQMNTNINATLTTDYLGEDVDIIIVDGGVFWNHPEFAVNYDGSGGSRFVQYNWFDLDSVVLGQSSNRIYNYDYSVGSTYRTFAYHGTMSASIAAGNSQGWARKANIYNINIFDTNQIGSYLIWDYIKAFHNSKNGSRPTIVNASYTTTMTAKYKNDPTDTSYMPEEIDRIVFQNNTYNGPFVEWENPSLPTLCINNKCNDSYSPNNGIVNFDMLGLGMSAIRGKCVGQNNTILYCAIEVGVSLSAQDADIEDLQSAGVAVIVASSNDGVINVSPNDINYNNAIYLKYTPQLPLYYNRKPTPSNKATLVVGALDSEVVGDSHTIANYSRRGPGVDIWAAGHLLIGLTRVTSGFDDHRDPYLKLASLSGTSFASPQVAGVGACILSANKNMSPTMLKNFILDNATTNKIYESTQWTKPGDGTPDTQKFYINALHGSPNAMLKNPYSIATINNTILMNNIEVLIYNKTTPLNLNSLPDNVKAKIIKIVAVNSTTGQSYRIWSPTIGVYQFGTLECGETYLIESSAIGYNLSDNMIEPDVLC